MTKATHQHLSFGAIGLPLALLAPFAFIAMKSFFWGQDDSSFLFHFAVYCIGYTPLLAFGISLIGVFRDSSKRLAITGVCISGLMIARHIADVLIH
jgi:ABC-type multidrug transport system permease subunit